MAELLSFDDRAADWTGVQGAIYRIHQAYSYTYTGPVRNLRHRLVVVPPDVHGDQRLLGHEVVVDGTNGGYELRWEIDAFGNRVCQIAVSRVEQRIDFDISYEVQRTRQSEWVHSAGEWDLDDYLAQTKHTTPDDRFELVAWELRQATREPRELAERANQWAASAIRYEAGVTTHRTSAADALRMGRGVCQDYAHIMITLLRLLDIPARYVSGHLLGEGAPHAWVEALIPRREDPDRIEIVAYDPTHRRRAGLSYVTVAVGRDFGDISPTSGYFTGHASGQLSWRKQAEVMRVQYADGRAAASYG